MSLDTKSQPSKVCPTCGTRINQNATRCLVCGRNFTSLSQAEGTTPSSQSIQGPRMPEVTLSLPIALGLMLLVLAIGAGVVFLILKSTDSIVEPTPSVTPSLTATITLTPTMSLTPSPYPTATPLPPFEYTVTEGDYCSTIAASFNVSVNSIVLLNNLPADCGFLTVGQKLLIPQPTPTASPYPSATLSGAEATADACEKIYYTVQTNDTLSTIAQNYNVSAESIKEFNSLSGDIVFEGATLVIPLCERQPTAGPTPTATFPPPYPAPNLLKPSDGASYTANNETITLQWASVGTLQDNEAYVVNIEDVTEGTGRKLVEYVRDTKYIVPTGFRPRDNMPHVIRWWVLPARQIGTTEDGEPIWDSAGTVSKERVFSWSGISAAATPEP